MSAACIYCHGSGYESLENGDGSVCLTPCGWCGGKRRASGATLTEITRLHRLSASAARLTEASK